MLRVNYFGFGHYNEVTALGELQDLFLMSYVQPVLLLLHTIKISLKIDRI